MIALALHAVLVMAAAVLVAWLRPRLAAYLAGCDAPAPPWRDARRLWRKHDPRSGAGWVAIAPGAALALTIGAALIVPSFTLGMASAPWADLPTAFLLLAAGRAIELLSAIAANGAPGGWGAGRVIRAWIWFGPALVLAALVMAGAGGSANLDAALATLHEGWSSGSSPPVRLPLLLAAAAVLVVGLVDDAPWLSDGLGGPSLAMARATTVLRQVVWLGLAVTLAGPAPGPEPGGWALGAALWAGKVAILTAACAVWEGQGRDRPSPALAGLLALLGSLLLAFGPGSA